jgi:hypothetical protein
MAREPAAPPSRARRITLWWAFIGASFAGAAVIYLLFRLRMNATGWSGSFPIDIYVSAVASWVVALLAVVAVLEIFGRVRLGGPHAGRLREPWVPAVAILLGVGLGYLCWK